MHRRSHNPEPPATHLRASALKATTASTERYEARFREHFAPDFYRQTSFGPIVSSIGIGTYLGDCDDADDAAYAASVQHAVVRGINLIDTAINYRCERSERSVGTAIQRILAGGEIPRESLIICTKG